MRPAKPGARTTPRFYRRSVLSPTVTLLARAADELVRRGCPPGEIVVVDQSENALEEAVDQELATVHADATHNAVLAAAGIERARSLIVTPGRDDGAVLIALTARRLSHGRVALRERA